MNLALLSPKVWLEIAAAALIAFCVWYGYNWIYDRGAASVQVKWDKEKQSIAEQSAKIAADALATTKSLTVTIEQQRSTANEQIGNLNRSLSAAITGLSNRPSRTGEIGVSGNTGTSAGCYPASLYREDAAVALKLAAEADKLRVLLGQCQAAYNSARDAVK